MSCYHPLKGFPVGKTENGKTQYKIVSYGTHHVELQGDKWVPVKEPMVSSFATRFVTRSVDIPCGKCIGCRLDYSRQWANRCMLELEDHAESWFVTLTYDDEHLPRSVYGDSVTGEAHPVATLRKRDFQLFMKRLRKRFGDGIRFFAAGEYGSETLRPHYHAIIYGLHLDDLEFYKKSALGFSYFNSPSLQACWSIDGKPIGYAVVGSVSWESCAYVARYIMKKQKGDTAHVYEDFNIEPEFCLMSRRPGIARNYYDTHPDCMQFDKINLSTDTGGKSFPPPRYFERLFDIDFPAESEVRKKKKKKIMEAQRELKKSLTDKEYCDMLEIEERSKLSRIKSLRRIL